MGRWVDRPRVYPHKCAISGKGDVESGPYFEFDREYYEHPADDATPARLYIRAKYLRGAFDVDGSPIRVAPEEELVALEVELEDVKATLAERESELNLANVSLEHERDVFARARVRNSAPARKTAPKKAAAKKTVVADEGAEQ